MKKYIFLFLTCLVVGQVQASPMLPEIFGFAEQLSEIDELHELPVVSNLLHHNKNTIKKVVKKFVKEEKKEFAKISKMEMTLCSRILKVSSKKNLSTDQVKRTTDMVCNSITQQLESLIGNYALAKKMIGIVADKIMGTPFDLTLEDSVLVLAGGELNSVIKQVIEDKSLDCWENDDDCMLSQSLLRSSFGQEYRLIRNEGIKTIKSYRMEIHADCPTSEIMNASYDSDDSHNLFRIRRRLLKGNFMN